jgi:hypothetical protein
MFHIHNKHMNNYTSIPLLFHSDSVLFHFELALLSLWFDFGIILRLLRSQIEFFVFGWYRDVPLKSTSLPNFDIQKVHGFLGIHGPPELSLGSVWDQFGWVCKSVLGINLTLLCTILVHL